MAGQFSASKKKKKRPTRPKSLASGRPPLTAPTSLLSSKHTREIINGHHLLHRKPALARRSQGSTPEFKAPEAQVGAQIGINSYQLASRTGQRSDRGGDSSRVLVQWLTDEIRACKTAQNQSAKRKTERDTSTVPPIRILEVGALSTRNALNIPGITSVKRIDLHSVAQGIEEVDFMDFPAPTGEEGDEFYDVLSLSLVLNYAPSPKSRGDMLKRTTLFLRSALFPLAMESGITDEDDREEPIEKEPVQDDKAFIAEKPYRTLPCLFLVLPAACLDNSRYLTASHLDSMLRLLGYTHLQTKNTLKMHYSLWRYEGKRAVDEWVTNGGQVTFKKTLICPGGGRNNFCVILD